MPTKLPLSEYRSLMATDTGRKMIKDEGITPEMEQAEQPSMGGFLGHLKEKAGNVIDRVIRPRRLIDIGRKAREFGAGMRYLSDANAEASSPKGISVDRLQQLKEERKRRVVE